VKTLAAIDQVDRSNILRPGPVLPALLWRISINPMSDLEFIEEWNILKRKCTKKLTEN